MALVELQDCNWEASGCAVRSFLVCFWYNFKAASNIAWKREEAGAAEGIWDMGEVVTVEESITICVVRVGTLGRRRTPPRGQASNEGAGERRCIDKRA